MKEIKVSIKNNYSCQVCQKEFQSEAPLDMTLGLKPVCSYHCSFRMIYSILMEYDIKSLEEMALSLKVNKICSKDKGKFVFLITKKYLSKILPINSLAQAQAQNSWLKSVDQGFGSKVGSTPPLIGGLSHEPRASPAFSGSRKLSQLSYKFEGGKFK